jgi:hypothetical protein
MSPQAARAYSVFQQARQRCTNPNHQSYAYYGARGIRVEYSVREFIGWYLHQLSKNPGIQKPATGRIDHSKNYRLDNIEMVEHSDNTIEVNTRLGNPSKRHVKVLAETRDGLRLYFDSVGECARICGISRDRLIEVLTGKMESPIPQLVFSYS